MERQAWRWGVWHRRGRAVRGLFRGRKVLAHLRLFLRAHHILIERVKPLARGRRFSRLLRPGLFIFVEG
jgi:hypothetical protein